MVGVGGLGLRGRVRGGRFMVADKMRVKGKWVYHMRFYTKTYFCETT
jgi:hypothetical protein